MFENLKNKRIILASKSPRRKQLLSKLGLQFVVKTIDADETYPANMPIDEVAEYLAKKKSDPFLLTIDDKTLVISADTIVAVDDEILGKPADFAEAVLMLEKLSGKAHRVLTGVCISSKLKQISFTASTGVYFKKLSSDEIDHYVSNYQPFDKAGAYGIQEWIGYVAVERIEGSYFNVMGLPVQRLYEEIQNF